MTDTYISLQRFPYDDSAWHVELKASNGLFSGTQDFYTYPKELNAFGVNLCRFPKNIQDEARFEVGDRAGNWAYFILIRVFLFDAVGHAAIEFAVDNHQTSPNRAQTSFFIKTEVAAINNFGQQLQSWVISHDVPLTWFPYTL
ncbi:MAG: hypothetical protein AAF215_22150 [Cyanobacteria bacterium P01_A01_bin.123]